MILISKKLAGVFLSCFLVGILGEGCKYLKESSSSEEVVEFDFNAKKILKSKTSSCEDVKQGIKGVYTTKNFNEEEHLGIAILTKSGKVYTGGNFKIDTPIRKDQVLENIVGISTTAQAFAALKSDGTVVSWGNYNYGGNADIVSKDLYNVIYINSTDSAFLAIKKDGTVVSWGGFGGNLSDEIKEKLKGVRRVVSNERAFVGMVPETDYVSKTMKKNKGKNKKVKPVTTYKLVSWGSAGFGGNTDGMEEELEHVIDLKATEQAFSALRDDGTVVSWGAYDYGGDNSSVKEGLKNVVSIYSNSYAFSAVKEDGTVVSWGNDENGGGFRSRLKFKPSSISTTWRAFCGITVQGSRVICWGNRYFGEDTSRVRKELHGIKKVYASSSNFVALRKDGAIFSWGGDELNDSFENVKKYVSKDVKQVFSTYNAFLALKKDNSVVAWNGVLNKKNRYRSRVISYGVSKIYPLQSDFLYLTTNGKVSTILDGGKLFGLFCSAK